MLDEPKALADCLARLALAQAAPATPRVPRDLPPPRRGRGALRRLRARRSCRRRCAPPSSSGLAAIPGDARAVPAFAPLAERKRPSRPAGGAPARRGAAAPPAAAAVPLPPRRHRAPGPSPADGRRSPRAPAAAVPTMAAEPSEPSPPPPSARSSRRRGGSWRRAPGPRPQAGPPARPRGGRRAPRDREAQHLAAEAAYRISRWRDAAPTSGAAATPARTSPSCCSTWPSPSSSPATPPPRPSRALAAEPQRTPYVDDYAKKILGP